MKRTYILSAIVVAIALGLGISEVRAVDEFPTEPLTVPRECTTSDGYVTIVAGPDANGEPADVFPRVVTCPDPVDCPGSNSWTPPLVGQYLLWEYLFTYTGINPSHALLSVRSTIEIAQAYPSAWVSLPGEGDARLGENMYESRVLRYNANSTTYRARYFTELGMGVVLDSGGHQSGKKEGYCALAGAGTVAAEPGQAIKDEECFQLPGTPCVVCYKVASNGKVVPNSMYLVEGGPPDCVIDESSDPIEIDDKPVEFVGPVQFTTGGSCKYCWTNTYGGKSCCSCTTCCINKNTDKCIQVATDPATKCIKCKPASKPADICSGY